MQHYASCCCWCQDFPESPAWHAVLVRPGLSNAQARKYLHSKPHVLARRAAQTRLKLHWGSPGSTEGCARNNACSVLVSKTYWISKVSGCLVNSTHVLVSFKSCHTNLEDKEVCLLPFFVENIHSHTAAFHEATLAYSPKYDVFHHWPSLSSISVTVSVTVS